jgi:hypothetical protein
LGRLTAAGSLASIAVMAHREGTIVTAKEGDLTPLFLLAPDRMPDTELHPAIASASDRYLIDDVADDPAPPAESFFARCAARIRDFARARRRG